MREPSVRTAIIVILVALLAGCGPAAPTAVPATLPAPTATVPPTETPVPPPTVPTAAPTPEPTTVPAPEPTATPAVLTEEVTLVTTDSITLAATLFGEGEVAVLLLHMGAGGATQTSWHPLARELAARGFAALTLDFRGVGRSEGRLQYNRLIYDARAAFEFLHERGYRRIICMGASMGGTSCMRLAMEVELEGVVVLASTISTGDPNTVTVAGMTRLTMPKLFIVGSRDVNDVVNDTKKMYRTCPEPKELVVYDQPSHGTALFATSDGDNLRQKLLDFVEEIRHSGGLTIPDQGDAAVVGIRTYGGPDNDRVNDILLTADGGTLIAGLANNTHSSHRVNPGDARLIRTDAEGNVIWVRDYGRELPASFSSVIQVGEEAYVVLGEIASSATSDEYDLYLVKVDGAGNQVWSHTYGGGGLDFGKMVRQTADGGYILIGSKADAFVTGNLYQNNLYLIKTDAAGNEVWSQTYGDQILYLGWGVAQTPDGGYVLVGWEADTYDNRNVLVIKIDELGDVEWSQTWDLGERDGGFDLALTSDGNIVVACNVSMGSGAPNAVLLKIDLDGNEIWNKTIGHEDEGNTLWHVMEDSDGGYVVTGDTHLGVRPGTQEVIHGALLVKTDADGEILWRRVFGGGEYGQAFVGSAVLLPEGGYIFVGSVTRYGEASSDMLWLKTDGEGNILGADPLGP